jgi:hypothetical protein
MLLGFKSVRRLGVHFSFADLAIKKLRRANLAIKSDTERDYEHHVVASLQASPRLRKNLITQIGDGEVDKVRQASLFGFRHRPDVAIGLDGTAVEIKVISGGPDVRDILGQAIAYRMDYRFVILVLVDRTDGRQPVALCRDKKSREYILPLNLARDSNVFSVVGPLSQGINLVFQ